MLSVVWIPLAAVLIVSSGCRTDQRTRMAGHRIFTTPFASVYPHYIHKAERKGRTKEEVDEIICWLTGYDRAGLAEVLEQQVDFDTFFAQAPAMNPNCHLITGVVCGVRVENVEDPVTELPLQFRAWYDANNGVYKFSVGVLYGVAAGNTTALKRITSA